MDAFLYFSVYICLEGPSIKGPLWRVVVYHLLGAIEYVVEFKRGKTIAEGVQTVVLDTITRSLNSSHVPPSIGAVSSNPQMCPMHLDFPKFDGSDPLNDLSKAVEEQFDPFMFDCPRAQLFKLTQCGSVADYYSQFMILANRVDGLTDAALLDCFISGLHDPIHCEVIAQSPQSMLRVVSLAHLFYEKCLHKCRFPSIPITSTTSKTISKPMSPAPVKRISPAELQLRQEKGLCFTCDEKYSWNHKCPNKHLMLLFSNLVDPPGDPSSDVVFASPPDVYDDGSSPPLHHLSLHAYHGSPSCATIRFQGIIAGKMVQVLLDGGSSDSFIQPRLARRL
ncbi:Retrotransposon gag domain [Sesbania bispinosa]|nr:Retrotransposon gag domain [Sesbania bispinosa]